MIMPVSPHDSHRFISSILSQAQRVEQAAVRAATRLLRRDIDKNPDEWRTAAMKGTQGYMDNLRDAMNSEIPALSKSITRAEEAAFTHGWKALEKDSGMNLGKTPLPTRKTAQIENVWKSYPQRAAERLKKVIGVVYIAKGETVEEKLANSQGTLTKELGSGFRVIPHKNKNYTLTSYTTTQVVESLSGLVMDAYTQTPVNQLPYRYVPMVPTVCQICEPWLGQVLSNGGVMGSILFEGKKIDVKHTVQEARAAGLWHPNCRHEALVWRTVSDNKTGRGHLSGDKPTNSLNIGKPEPRKPEQEFEKKNRASREEHRSILKRFTNFAKKITPRRKGKDYA